MWLPGDGQFLPRKQDEMPKRTLGDGTLETGVKDITGKEGDHIGLALELLAFAVLFAHGNEARHSAHGF